MTEKYLNESLKKYLDDLSAKLPAPGGGSASAAVGAVGVACLLMVVNFTIDKKGYEQYQDELKQILSVLRSLFSALSSLIDEDVEAYSKLSEAYKLPKNTVEEKELRSQKIQEALKSAMEIPWSILLNSREALSYCRRIREVGNKNLLSDVDCGEAFLKSAIFGAKINVEINLKSITDESFVAQKRHELSKILEEI